MKLLKKVMIASSFLMLVAGCGSAEQSANKYLGSGINLVKKEQFAKARLEFKNALQLDPRLAEAYYQLALLDEREQKWQPMFKSLQTVESLSPNHIEAITKLGQIHLLAGNIDDAKEKAEKVFKINPNFIPGLLLKASIAMNQEQFEEAISFVADALNYDPKNIDALSLKALIENKRGNIKEALNLVDEALALSEEDGQLSLNMIKLSIYEEQKDYSAMVSIYENIQKQKPNEFWIVSALSKLKYQQKDYAGAIALLENFINNNSTNDEAKEMLLALLAEKQPERLISQLDEFIAQDSSNLEYRFRKIELLYKSERQQEAIDELQDIIKHSPNTDESRKALNILAALDFTSGNVEIAESKLETILAQDSSNQEALLLKSRIDFNRGKYDEVISNLRIVNGNNPEFEQGQLLLAQTYRATGATDLAEDSYRKVLDINPSNSVAALAVSEALINENDLDSAENVLIQALKDGQENESINRALTQIKLLQQDWEGAQALLGKVELKEASDSLWKHYISGVIAEGQKRFRDAIEEYEFAINIEPSFVRALQGIAQSYRNLGLKMELKQYLSNFINNHPEIMLAYDILSQISADDKQWEEAVGIIKNALSVQPLWQQGYSRLASYYYAQGMKEDAIASYVSGVEKNPTSIGLKLQLASSYDQIGEYDKAKLLYEEILEFSPDIEPAINNLASLLTDRYETPANLKIAETLTARFKESSEPYYLDTYAWVQVKLGNYSEAEIILKRAISLAPNVAIFQYHLANLHYLIGNLVDATSTLTKAKNLAKQENDALTLKSITDLEKKINLE
jgi:tetratricopeptide (TPR) repeat protein